MHIYDRSAVVMEKPDAAFLNMVMDRLQDVEQQAQQHRTEMTDLRARLTVLERPKLNFGVIQPLEKCFSDGSSMSWTLGEDARIFRRGEECALAPPHSDIVLSYETIHLGVRLADTQGMAWRAALVYLMLPGSAGRPVTLGGLVERVNVLVHERSGAEFAGAHTWSIKQHGGIEWSLYVLPPFYTCTLGLPES